MLMTDRDGAKARLTRDPRRIQFTVRSLLVAALLVACVLPLCQWMGWGLVVFVVVPMGAVPGSVLLEYCLGRPPAAQPRQLRAWYIRSHATLLLWALVPAAVALFVERAGFAFAPQDLPLWSPLPLLVMLPQFLDFPSSLIAAVSFLFLNLYLARAAEPAPVPTRFPIMLSLATILSLAWFLPLCSGTTRSMTYFRPAYIWGVSFISLSSLAALWVLWAFLRSRATRGQAIALAVLLHCWFFWYAFPFCWLE